MLTAIGVKLLMHLLSTIQQFFTLRRKRVLFGWFRSRTTCRMGWHGDFLPCVPACTAAGRHEDHGEKDSTYFGRWPRRIAEITYCLYCGWPADEWEDHEQD